MSGVMISLVQLELGFPITDLQISRTAIERNYIILPPLGGASELTAYCVNIELNNNTACSKLLNSP